MCNTVETEAVFEERIRNHVLRLVKNGVHSFHEILCRCQNCDPAHLKQLLQEKFNGTIVWQSKQNGFSYRSIIGDHDDALWPMDGAGCYEEDAAQLSMVPFTGKMFWSSLRQILAVLPEPTPVFSQWWFSYRTYPRMLAFLAQLQKSPTQVAFLGCPSLGALFSQLSEIPTVILDIDTAILARISSHCSSNTITVPYDVTTELDPYFHKKFDIVFADPPWGRDMLSQFLLRASECLSDRGVLAITLPQLLTRPGIPQERENLLRQACEMGLQLTRVFPNATEYQIPPFERAGYHGAGIALNGSWRRGDLFVFNRMPLKRRSPRVSATLSPCAWDQFEFGDQRVFLHREETLVNMPLRILPVPGFKSFLCPTTSSRHAMLKHASLVTTRNGFAVVEGWREFAELLPQLTAQIVNLRNRNESLDHQDNLLCHMATLLNRSLHVS